MPFVSLQSSPLLPGVSPVEIYYRDEGEGPPLVLLHGGWGYNLYPFHRQIEKLRDTFRVISPDRSGYGRSTHLGEFNDLPTDFHYRAALETLSFLDSLGIERAFLWGHSDGAVIAAIIGFKAPGRVLGLVLEAFHFYGKKPGSGELFQTLAYQPEALGSELCERFALEFGGEDWRKLITSHAKAWLQLAVANHRENPVAGNLESPGESDPRDNLYRGRLTEIRAPTLFIHGSLDPRTEPGELDAASQQLPHAEMRILDGAAHSPHSESAAADLVTRLAREFLTKQKPDGW